ncbi:hypothetical protein Scep_002555 [Stephania cephalantha]|uniref:Uncharacterized protein n=1 Tax=Stephania cephalantha TaxID=152367 RepID=A0AAP0Q614_9MAGN
MEWRKWMRQMRGEEEEVGKDRDEDREKKGKFITGPTTCARHLPVLFSVSKFVSTCMYNSKKESDREVRERREERERVKEEGKERENWRRRERRRREIYGGGDRWCGRHRRAATPATGAVERRSAADHGYTEAADNKHVSRTNGTAAHELSGGIGSRSRDGDSK